MGIHDRAFRLLTRLLPAEFRGDYGREMEATFRADRRSASGAIGVFRLWLATIADVFRTAPAEHADMLRRDLSYTVRMLARRPTLTVTAIVTLAIGIGANTAMFSVVNGVLFAPLPYPDADRLVLLQEKEPDEDPGTTGYYSFDQLRMQQTSMEWMAALASWSAIIAGDGRDAERVAGARVTWEYFRTLGVSPAIGRDFEQGEDDPARRRVVLLSDRLWRRRFNADPSIVGKPVTINTVTYTIAGIMPPQMNELVTSRLFASPEIWTLLGYSPELPQACRSCRHLFMLGRLKPGVAVSAAAADLTRIYQSLGVQFARDYQLPTAAVVSIRDYFLGPSRQALLLLWGAVGLLLLMACANIANLLLIRASEREEEIAIRRALGVSPARLMRQLLTESLVLASLGGIAGALLAAWGTRVLTQNAPDAIPRLDEVALNGPVLLYAIGVSLLTGVIFGMAPARMLINRQMATGAMPDEVPGVRWSTAGSAAWRYRSALIAINVALSAVLLVGSGLLVRSFLHLVTVDAGFDPSDTLTLQVFLTGRDYGDNAAINRFYDALGNRIRSMPGVVSVSASTNLPLSGNVDRSGIAIEGRPAADAASAPEADTYAVRDGYFRTMGIPLRRGRLFTAGDGTGAAPVVIINEAFAKSEWPGQDPIGRRLRVAGGPDNPMRTIVGIVGDVRHYGLHLPATPQVYVPHPQTRYPQPFAAMVVRVSPGVDPLSIVPDIRTELRAIDPLQPMTRVRTYSALVAESMATRRFTLSLLALFAGTALLLAIIGLYGALSYVVSQRQREIGVRVALGAAASDIRRLVVTQGMSPAVIGLAIGLALGLLAARSLGSMLFGVAPTDAATLAAVVGIIGGSGLAACLLPARRASRIDPAVTLRST